MSTTVAGETVAVNTTVGSALDHVKVTPCSLPLPRFKGVQTAADVVALGGGGTVYVVRVVPATSTWSLQAASVWVTLLWAPAPARAPTASRADRPPVTITRRAP